MCVCMPVRHNEDQLNGQLAKLLPWRVHERDWEDAHCKAFLLLQAHFARVPLPISDYHNDTKSVLDQALRVLNVRPLLAHTSASAAAAARLAHALLSMCVADAVPCGMQAMVDIAADTGVVTTTLRAMQLSQCIIQARFPDESTLRQLPHMKDNVVAALQRAGVSCLPQAMELPPARLKKVLQAVLKPKFAQDVADMCAKLPRIDMRAGITPKGGKAGPLVQLGRADAPTTHVRAVQQRVDAAQPLMCCVLSRSLRMQTWCCL